MKSLEDQTEFLLEPALDFLQHIWQLNHALERRSLQMERAIGVTAQQRLFVRCIGKYPGMTASQLASILHLDRGTVSVGLSRLMKKELVVGRRDASDKRRVALILTVKGKAIDKPDGRSVEHAVERLLARLGRSETVKVKAVLAQLAASLIKRIDAGD